VSLPARRCGYNLQRRCTMNSGSFTLFWDETLLPTMSEVASLVVGSGFGTDYAQQLYLLSPPLKTAAYYT
ncbi:hypothetical protein, partial [Bacteroides heparinolyticus]|uniref:hypothetical protein n=2 Tax=Prevotella heparinolytica TaxID=28113 RepID=UPI0035A122F7